MSNRDQYCPIYRSLDLFGDRWGLLVVREILRGVTRFNELERRLPGISRASLCPEHPGFPEDVFVTARPADLYRLVVGQQSLEQAIDEGAVQVTGPPAFVRSLPKWFLLRASGPAIEAAPARR